MIIATVVNLIINYSLFKMYIFRSAGIRLTLTLRPTNESGIFNWKIITFLNYKKVQGRLKIYSAIPRPHTLKVNFKITKKVVSIEKEIGNQENNPRWCCLRWGLALPPGASRALTFDLSR